MKAPDDLPIYTVGKVATLAHVPAQTIRDWQRQGLLNPARTKGQHRLFSENDLRRIMTIRRLHREEGVKLSAIGELLARQETVAEQPNESLMKPTEKEPAAFLSLPFSNIAMESLATFAAKREEAEVSSSLLRAATAISNHADLGDLLESVAVATGEMVRLGRVLIYLWDPDKRAFILAKAHIGGEGRYERSFPSSLGHDEAPAFDELLRSKVPVLVEETGASNVVPKHFIEEYGFRSILLVPLTSRNEAVGALLVDEPGIARRFTFREIAAVQGIANLAAGPIQSIRSYERAQRDLRTKEALLEEAHLGVSDCLTGLLRFESNGADSATRDQMETTIRRLQSIATVHRLLAENRGEQIPLPSLVSRLSQSVRAEFTGQGKRVRIQVPDNDITIDQKRAAPLGIVLGELFEALTAFPFTQEDEGMVIVEAQEDDSSVSLEVRVAAIVGARSSFTGAISATAKGVLERTVTEQLGGSLQLGEDKPVATITFPRA